MANFVIPNRVVAEVYARSTPGAYRTWTTPRIVNAWWVAFLLTIIRYQETTRYVDTATRTVVQETSTPTFILLLNAAAGVISAVLAALIVHRVSAWHDAWRPPAG